MKFKLDYIWLDGSNPTQQLRSKVRIVENFSGKIEDCPKWSFDGSSTQQAEGNSSECILKPVFLCKNPLQINGYIIMNEVLRSDGTPHSTNARATIDDDDNDFWFGYEQEYFLIDCDTNVPLGFPADGTQPRPQGPYYCGVGARTAYGREIVEEHLDACLDAGLNIEGTNAEVACGQWEYQIFAKGAKRAADEIWVSRYIMELICEKYNVFLELHPKPLGKESDWNGSGMHANFSNNVMRTCRSKQVFDEICAEFGKHVQEHMDVYGAYNDQRLTGKHETASIHDFSWGVGSRGVSLRIPIGTVDDDWCGRIEDRRPASNGDPYKIGAVIVKSVKASGHF